MFLALTFALSIFSQDTTAATSATSSFMVDGIKVILRKNETNNIVVANLYILGGTRQAPVGKEGIEPFLMHVAERGTAKYPRDVMRRKLSLLGSDIFAGAANVDYTGAGLRTTTAIFDSTWAILADQIMAPTLQPSEVELVRRRIISGIRQQRDHPDPLVEFLADSITFVGHPYGIPPEGTEESISKITATDLRNYHKSAIVRSRMMLVVVGNISRAQVEAALRRTLVKLPLGNYKWTLPPAVPVQASAGSNVVIARRSLPTNYVLGYYPGPLASSNDYHALRIATTVLTERMFQEIRAKANLTYDVHAPYLDRALTSGGLYVTTVAPNRVLQIMRALVDELQNNAMSEFWMDMVVRHFIVTYLLDNETNGAQANFLAKAELYQGDYRKGLGEEFVRSLRRVTPQDVQRVARHYMRNMKFAYVGDPGALDQKLLDGFR